jgi:hypothetical protein
MFSSSIRVIDERVHDGVEDDVVGYPADGVVMEREDLTSALQWFITAHTS